MRLGLLPAIALLGLVSAAPVDLEKRGEKKCWCKKPSTQTPKAGSTAVVYGSDSSSSSSWEIDSSSSSSWGRGSSSHEDSGTIQRVVYVNVVPVIVPVTTTCMTTGTIVIENDIAINVTLAPTVITYTKTVSSTATETTTVTKSPTGTEEPTRRPASSIYSSNGTWTRYYPSTIPSSIISSSAIPSSIPASSTTTPYVQPTPLAKSSWDGHMVLGYYGVGESKFMPPDDVPWELLTHVCFAFGSISDDYTLNVTQDALVIMESTFSAAVAHGVKPILSVGGWGYGSSKYSEMVSSNETRATFIESLHDFVDQYNISGIDIDWEYPGRASDDSVPYNETTDVPNYLIFLEELREEFGTNLTLSAAVAALNPFDDDVSGFAEYFDFVCMMFYDFATGPGFNDTASDAPLYGSPSIVQGVQAWNDAGMPSSKMVFGIPSYGRSFTLVDPNSPSVDGLTNPVTSVRPQGDSDQSPETAVWKWRNLISQGVLAENTTAGDGVFVGANGWQQKFDYDTISPYVWNNVTGEWISYDDPVSISYKREYAHDQGMLGVFVWEVSYDTDNGELLQYMN